MDSAARPGDLRKLAKKIKTDHELAMALWETGNVDARLLAILLIKPKTLSADEMDRMVRSVTFVQVAYCANLTAGGRAWRLPTCDELGSIADPSDTDAFGRQLLRPFHDGVSSNWLWSSDQDTAGAAFIYDFNEMSRDSLAVNFDEGAHALCVSD